MNTDTKIQALKEKAAKLTEELKNEIYEICQGLEYKESSIFSYNIDRIEQFNNELQKL